MKVAISVTIDAQEYAKATAYAEKQQINFSAYVSQAVKEMNDRMRIAYETAD